MPDPEEMDSATAQSEPESIPEEATKLMASAELELSAKGYSDALSRLAVSRALNTAEYRVADVSGAIQEQAFMDTLRAELNQAERWIHAQQAFLDRENEEGGD
jgi:hypothetical protein